MSRGKKDPRKPADVEIGASASARRLRFRRKPESKVEFEGRTRVRSDEGIEEAELESDSHSERRNLPEEVEPGVTYRNVEVGWIAGARAVMPERSERGQEAQEEGEEEPRGGQSGS